MLTIAQYKPFIIIVGNRHYYYRKDINLEICKYQTQIILDSFKAKSLII